MSKNNNTQKIVGLGLFTAIVIVLQLMGSFIRFGTFSISLVLVPVVIGAALYGAGAGAWLGFVFGVVVLLSGDAAAFLGVNALGTILTVLVKGTLAGLLSGLVYKALENKNRTLAVAVAAVVCPVVNTGVFLIGCLLAFATGTSWGTFGVLIPITMAIFPLDDPMGIVCIAACMAGAVCGDHCSPISDTTIMASAGAQCDHVNHVSTQLPYAISCAVISFVTYIVAGFVQTPFIALPVGIVLMLAFLFIMKQLSPGQSHRAA